MSKKIRSFCKKYASKFQVAAPVAGAVLSSGVANATDLIDYTALSTSLTTGLGTAITAAVTIGGAVLVARMGWRFFKSFSK